MSFDEFQTIARLVRAQITGTITLPEQAQLEGWISQSEDNKRIYEKYLSPEFFSELESISSGADKRLAFRRFQQEIAKAGRRRRLVRRLSGAAAVVVVAVAAFLMLPRSPETTDVIPGTYKAVLTLSDGSRVDLGGTHSETFDERGVRVVSDSGTLLYEPSGGAVGAGVNRIEVPRGGEYKLRLADGTTVWLNAGTELSYSTSFNGSEREVFLKGEAYFDVAPDADKPFFVRTGGYDVRVTGTQFNVRCFDAGHAATTLVEGAVEIWRGGERTALAPGQQALLSDGAVSVAEVDTDGFTAWKDGVFNFSQRSLGDIAADLARWYDLDIVYDDPALAGYHFSARFSRQAPIGEVLTVLGMTRTVRFNLDGKTLTITK